MHLPRSIIIAILSVLTAARIRQSLAEVVDQCEMEKNEMYLNKEFVDALVAYSVDCYMSSLLSDEDGCDASGFEEACRDISGGDFFMYSGKMNCRELGIDVSGSSTSTVEHEKTPACLPHSCGRDVTQLTGNSFGEENNSQLHCEFENINVEDYTPPNGTERPSSATYSIKPSSSPTKAPTPMPFAAPTMSTPTKAPIASTTTRGKAPSDPTSEAASKGLSFAVTLTATVVVWSIF